MVWFGLSPPRLAAQQTPMIFSLNVLGLHHYKTEPEKNIPPGIKKSGRITLPVFSPVSGWIQKESFQRFAEKIRDVKICTQKNIYRHAYPSGSC
jgi:hypothetical protein